MRAKRYMRKTRKTTKGVSNGIEIGLTRSELLRLQERLIVVFNQIRSAIPESNEDGRRNVARMLRHLAEKSGEPLARIYQFVNVFPIEPDYFG